MLKILFERLLWQINVTSKVVLFHGKPLTVVLLYFRASHGLPVISAAAAATHSCYMSYVIRGKYILTHKLLCMLALSMQ